VHVGTVSVSCYPHERSSSATSPRSLDNTGVRACTAATEEDRSAVRADEESHRPPSSAPAQVEVRPRAVLPGGHCTEHQTTGPVPEPSNNATGTCHCIGTGKGGTNGIHDRVQISRTPETGADFFNTHVCWRKLKSQLAFRVSARPGEACCGFARQPLGYSWQIEFC
jgi:hypothetical protein